MTATARLWRRAPLWRLVLASTATFAVLAALYPTPSLVAIVRALPRLASSIGTSIETSGRAGPASLPTSSHPASPASASGPPPAVIGLYPPFETVFTDTIRFAGRILPLPAGRWHEIVSGRDERHGEADFMTLARVDADALTGVIVASGSVVPASGPIQPALPYGCFDARSAVAVPPAEAGTGPHDCWFAGTVGLAGLAPNASARLKALGIAVPASLSATTWSRVEGPDALEVMIAVPGTTPKIRAGWMRAWRGLLRHGYDGTLTAAMVRSSRAAKDPT